MSHIKTIEIKNFKSIRHQKIEDCRRVNVFIGYPNVGKSNILEALGLYTLYNPIAVDDENEIQNKNEVEKFSELCRVRKNFELFYNQNTKQPISINFNNKLQLWLHDDNGQLSGRFRRLAAAKTKKGFIATSLLKFEVNDDFSVSFEEEQISSVRVVDFHVKKYDYTDSVIINKTKQSSLYAPTGDNLLDVIQRNPELRKDLAELFKKYNLRFAIENSSQSIRLLKEMSDDTIVIIPYYQIADTLRRLVFYKTAIFSNKDAILLFEEPEAHMFPPYIRKMTSDIIFDKNDNQYFIATHSPYVLDELVAGLENELSVYLVDYKDGETIIKYLSSEELKEVRDYGVDLFFNIESYLKDGQISNA